MINISEPEYLLICNFKKAGFKGRRNKQLYQVKSKEYTINDNQEFLKDIHIEYYKRLLDEGYSKTYAVILTLMLRQKVVGLNLRGKNMRIYFANNSHVKVDLTCPDLTDCYEDMLSDVIFQYKSERNKSLREAFNRRKTIIFTGSRRDMHSFYEETDSNATYELMCNDRAKAYNLEEEDLVNEALEKMINKQKEYNEEINIGEVYYDEGIKDSYSGYDAPIHIVTFSCENSDIILEALPTHICNNAIERIQDYNYEINNNKKELKKEIGKNERK